jgi:hypothetical protein
MYMFGTLTSIFMAAVSRNNNSNTKPFLPHTLSTGLHLGSSPSTASFSPRTRPLPIHCSSDWLRLIWAKTFRILVPQQSDPSYASCSHRLWRQKYTGCSETSVHKIHTRIIMPSPCHESIQQYRSTYRPPLSRDSKTFLQGAGLVPQPVLTFWVRTNLPQLRIEPVPPNPQPNHYTNTIFILMTTATSNNSRQSITMGTCFTARPLNDKYHLTSSNSYGNPLPILPVCTAYCVFHNCVSPL